MPDYTNPPQPPKGAVPIQKGNTPPPPPSGAVPIQRVQQPLTPMTSVERDAGGEQPFSPWMQKGLEKAYQYGVEPFDKMSGWMGKQMGDVFQEMYSMEPQKSSFQPAADIPMGQQQAPPAVRGIASSVGENIGGIAGDPRMWPFLAEPFMKPGLVSPMLSKATQLGFRGQMVYGAGEGAHNLYENWDQMSPEEKWKNATSVGIQSVFAGHGLPGDVRGAMTPPPPEGAIPLDKGQVQVPDEIKAVQEKLAAKEPSGPNAGREGQSQPTMEPASQMGAGGIAQDKAASAQAAPVSTSGATTPIEPVKEPLSTGTANDRPQVPFKPSEKAATMSAPRKIIPEAEQMAFQEETNRLRDVIKNPKATKEEHEMAAQKLGQMETIKQGYLGSAVSPAEQAAPVQPKPQPTPKPNMRTDPKGLDDLLTRQVGKGEISKSEKADISQRAGLKPTEDPRITRARERYQKDLGDKQPQIPTEKAKAVADDAARRRVLQEERIKEYFAGREKEKNAQTTPTQASKEPVSAPKAETPASGRPPEAKPADATPEPIREPESVGVPPSSPEEQERQRLLKRIQELSQAEPPKTEPSTKGKSKTQRALESVPVKDATKALDKRFQKPVDAKSKPPKADPSQKGFIGSPKPRKGMEAAERIKKEREAEEKGPFYNYSERVVREKMPNAAHPKDVASLLANSGVSKNELKWSNIDTFLQQKAKEGKSVSKQEVLDYLQKHNPKIEVTEKVAPDKKVKTANEEKLSQLQAARNRAYETAQAAVREYIGGNNLTSFVTAKFGDALRGEEQFNVRGVTTSTRPYSMDDFRREMEDEAGRKFTNSEFQDLKEKLQANITADEREMEHYDRMAEEHFSGSDYGPRYENYTLPGGENYREVLLRMPSERDAAVDRGVKEYGLSAGEADEELRSIGEKDDRYFSPHFDESNITAHLRLKDRIDSDGKKTLFIEEVQSDWDKELRETAKEGGRPGQIVDVGHADFRTTPPNMPFTQGHWMELAMKWALKEAANKGYDRIAWTTGEQQAERYNLQKYADMIVYNPETNTLSGHKGEDQARVFHRTPVSQDELRDYLGKDVAEKLLASGQKPHELYPNTQPKVYTLQGKDLAVGGQHHLALYDKMIPQFMERYGKKWGVKVGETKITVPSVGDTLAKNDYGRKVVHSMDIPSEMRDVLKKPLRQIGGSQAGVFSFRGQKYTPAKSVIDTIKDEASRVRESRRLADGIDDLTSMRQADIIRAKTAMEKVPGTRADHEAIYHWLEDKSLPLTQTQMDIVGKHLLPIMSDNARMVQKLKASGLPVEDYVHRIPTKKYSAAERILLGRKQIGGPVLSQSASALKGRKYEAMVDSSTGKRLVVSQKGDKIQVHWNNQITDMGVDRKTAEKAGFEFKTATTKEIEQHTPTQYLKHGFGNTLLSHLELKNAERAHDFLEAYTKTADFKSATMKVGTGNPPKGWHQVYGLKPLEGHYFEPHTAEVIQRYVDKLKAGDTGAFEKLNSFLRTSIFFNPMIHVPNIAAHWVVEKGTRGWMPDNYPRILKTSAKAIDILMHPERESVGGKPSYLDFLDKGAPLQGQRRTTKEATALLTSKMFTEFQQKPGLAKKVSEALGFAHPVNMVKALYDFSSKATWVVDDFARIQATLERMDREGLDAKTAMTDVSRHIPNYRLPTRIFDNRLLGKIMENPMVSMFGAYHYGALKSYGEMIKEFAGKGVTPGDRAKSFNRMAMLGLLATVIYPALDQLAKKSTGDDKARVRRAGAATFPDTINRLMHGKTSMWSAATSVVTPAPLVSIAKDLAVAGMKPKPIGDQLKDFGKNIYSKLGPISATNQARGKGQKGPIDWKRFFWSMLGVRHDSSGEKKQKGLSLGKMSLGKV